MDDPPMCYNTFDLSILHETADAKNAFSTNMLQIKQDFVKKKKVIFFNTRWRYTFDSLTAVNVNIFSFFDLLVRVKKINLKTNE